MPSRILSLPFIILILFLLYMTWEYDDKYFQYMIGPVIILATIWTLSPQINWWWYRKYPPKLDPPLLQILQRNFAYYHQLSVQNKARFRDRTALFMEGNDFSTPSMDESVPEDLKGMIAASAVQLTFGYKQFLFKNFEKIILYQKPFPSPQYPKFFHASETYIEDGVVLFAAQQVATAFFHGKDYLNLPLYEFAKVFKHIYPNEPYPQLPQPVWEKMEEISGFSTEAIQQWINLPIDDLDLMAISIHHFFMFPAAFHRIMPDLYQNFVIIFRQNPMSTSNPLII